MSGAGRHVVLVHGLWMPGAALWRLAAWLREAGCSTRIFGYRSISDGPGPAAARLADVLAGRECDVVAHSLGGLVTLATLAAQPRLPVRRVVCLGSPLRGSTAAKGLQRLGAGGLLLGRSASLLCSGLPSWQGTAEVGVIAGEAALGLGRIVGRFDGPNDGTVAVEETRIEGLADHVCLPVSHTGLVFSPQVARAALGFLEHGRFPRPR